MPASEPAGPRYSDLPGQCGVVGCLDCGVVVFDTAAHTRSHSILGAHAWALAVLETSHIAAHAHDRYDARERIARRKFDSWSADAFEEVTGVKARPGEEMFAVTRPATDETPEGGG
jgi:hypothetical protein